MTDFVAVVSYKLTSWRTEIINQQTSYVQPCLVNGKRLYQLRCQDDILDLIWALAQSNQCSTTTNLFVLEIWSYK